MLYEYPYETDFQAFNEAGEAVYVYVTFDIDEDYEEDYSCGRAIERKVYGIERGHVTARLVTKSIMYVPTEADLKEWESDIQRTLSQELKRQVA